VGLLGGPASAERGSTNRPRLAGPGADVDAAAVPVADVSTPIGDNGIGGIRTGEFVVDEAHEVGPCGRPSACVGLAGE
jgi:hypothetical protein